MNGCRKSENLEKAARLGRFVAALLYRKRSKPKKEGKGDGKA